MYNAGVGMLSISKYLNEEFGQMRHWGKTSVYEILNNEKHFGDSRFQKNIRLIYFLFARSEIMENARSIMCRIAIKE